MQNIAGKVHWRPPWTPAELTSVGDGRREVAANNSAGNSSVPFDRDRRLTLANPERMALNTVSESGFRREQVVLRTVDTVSLPRIVVPASSGAPKEMERRLAAIVCADVAGYSRMMGGDEAGTHATFKAHRTAVHPIILNHGGRLVKNTGDGFLLEFPSIVGAIEAAIDMQALMAERNKI